VVRAEVAERPTFLEFGMQTSPEHGNPPNNVNAIPIAAMSLSVPSRRLLRGGKEPQYRRSNVDLIRY
jgi:hypothetical protein